VASLNCQRRGNDPPTMAEVAAARGHLKPLPSHAGTQPA
jgi:hypothetical protein